jgi:hypothetical protein
MTTPTPPDPERREPEASTRPSLPPTTALDVLAQLHAELGTVDPEVRAIVAIRVTGPGSVTLADVTLHDNDILEAPDDAAGLVVVTGERVTAPGEDGPDDDPVALHQLVCILRDGHEVGLVSADDEDRAQAWSTADDPEGVAAALRPRDAASNAARRAFGLPSVVDLPPVTDLLARAWLLAVSTEALQRFDGPDGPTDVAVEDLEEVASRPPMGTLGAAADEPPSWDRVHEAAVAGELELGPFTVDASHAAWLDAPGLAQLLDVTVPPTEELLGTLQVTGDDDLLGWAIGELSARGWLDAA